jgi:hypothetical protein
MEFERWRYCHNTTIARDMIADHPLAHEGGLWAPLTQVHFCRRGIGDCDNGKIPITRQEEL